MLGFRFIKVDPTDFVLRFRRGDAPVATRRRGGGRVADVALAGPARVVFEADVQSNGRAAKELRKG